MTFSTGTYLHNTRIIYFPQAQCLLQFNWTPLAYAVSLHEPGQDVHENGDADVGGHHVDPDFERERREKRKERRRHLARLLVNNCDAEIHKRHRKVDRFFALRIDREIRDGHVGPLEMRAKELEKHCVSWLVGKTPWLAGGN